MRTKSPCSSDVDRDPNPLHARDGLHIATTEKRLAKPFRLVDDLREQAPQELARKDDVTLAVAQDRGLLFVRERRAGEDALPEAVLFLRRRQGESETAGRVD